ncbi:MAG: chitobiase/beta-hexosaminidase C-terminal domain-containing protein [Bacteroidales bacterium]|nr:chitobiase/beta-hexosaminidase C-terminal domain-containing protein [Bacteroidales bacterium]
MTVVWTKKTGGGTPTCATPTFNPAAGLYTTAQNVTISTETSGATIRYTTDGTDPTESSSVYSAPISVSANTTIKAMATATGYNTSSIATANYYFVEHVGTDTDPYSVADARSAIDAGSGVTDVYATGIVSEIVTAFNQEYGNISYNISTDGTTTAAQLQAYRGKSFDGANFTSADDILVGDRVVVKGNLTKHNDIYEFAQNNQLVSQTHPSTIVIPSSELALPCTANNNGSFTVTYTNSFVSALTTADLFDNETCTEAFTDDWIILDNIDDPYNTIPFVLEANPSKTPRTVYMKVEAVNSDNYLIERVFTIIQEGQPTYTVTYDANGGGGTMTDPDSPYIAGDIVELLTNSFTAPDGKVWDSWVVTDAENNAVAVEGGMFEMPASNVTVTAQWVADPNAPQYEWVLTDLADLTSTDIFVIVGTRDATNYYGMSNNNGTSTQPSAVGVTIANNKLSSDPADNIKWNVSGDNTNGYVFYPNGSTTTWLYCNTTASSSSNTNMRVGTGDRKLFVLDNNNYLVTKDEYTNRYVSLNGSTDWRGYTNTGQATVISFFKRQVASTDPAVYTSVSAIDLAYDETGSSFTYSLENAASEYTMNVTVNPAAQSWLSATINTTTSTVTITANVNDGAQREGIVTVNYLEGGNIEAYEQVTVTQAEFVIDYAALPFDFVGNEDPKPTGVTTTAGTYAASPYLKFDATGKYLTLKLEETPLSLSYDIKVNGTYGSESVFDVQTSADGQTWTSLVSYTTMSSDVQTVTHLNLPSSVRFIKWIYTNKDSGNVGLGNIHASDKYDIYGDVTVAELTIPADKVCTIYSPATLNVTNSLTNEATTEAWNNLVIKDGAQLKTPNEVNGTVEKVVAGYGSSEKNNYVLLATPATMDACNHTGMWNTADQTQHANVDLYAFNQKFNGEEWRNYKYGNTYFAGPIAITQGTGYLYANKEDVTLTLETRGYVAPNTSHQPHPFSATSADIDVAVSYSNDKPFAGWNLIGNPFTCKAYLADGSDFYRMNADGNGLIINTDAQGGGNAINVCEGIFVETTAAETKVTFTTTDPTVTSTGNNNGMVNISVAQVVNSRDAQPSADYARIRVNNGKDMTKFVFNENTSRVYIPQGNKDYAVVRSEARGEMPVNFKAAENGTYTIDVEAENLEVNYLHLIDNLTGMDVDLLATPSYTFEARKSDIASRFRLVFDANTGNDETNDNFAFINNGELIVNGNGTVQVIDILGRQMFSHEVNSAFRIQNSEFAPGVYVLRLVNGNDVKTQKIVIK